MNDPVINIKDCDIIKCSNCSKRLMIVPRHEHSEKLLYLLQVDCPYCGDHSYDYEVKGPLKYYFPDNIKFKNFQEGDGRVKFITTL